LECFL
jgi:hypothetical protein